MFILFQVDEKQQEAIELPFNQRFALVQGIPMLEELNRELIATSQKVTLTYEIYYDKAQELPTLTAAIHLPITEGTVVEALQQPVIDNQDIDPEDAKVFLNLFQKNAPKQKRKRSVKKRKTGTNLEQEAANKEKIIQVPYSQGRMTVKFATFLKVGFLFFLLLAGFYLGKSVQSEPKIPSEVSEQLDNLEKQVQQQPKIDTFSRYFLTQYYGGTTNNKEVQAKVKRYVDKEIVSALKGTESHLKSVLPWNIQKKEDVWEVAYVLTLQKEREFTMVHVQFSIKEQDKQYKVMTVPKEEPFEINE